jgi:hypothetical protein
LANWERNDGKQDDAPFTVFAGKQRDRFWPEVEAASDGCVRNTGSRKDDQFICVPIGIRPDGLQIEARHALQFSACDPLTGERLQSATMQAGEQLTLPAGPGALIVLGSVLPADGKPSEIDSGRP